MPQTAHVFEHATGTLRYLRHLPPGYGEGGPRRWPLVLFLHGAGERGHHPRRLLAQGLPRHAAAHPELPVVLVSPQCTAASGWYVHIPTVSALLDEALGDPAVDPDRVYLTGISMGGFGAWYLGTRRPTTFAAVVPICGYGQRRLGFPERVCALGDVPVRVYHGDADDVVPIAESDGLVAALRACGGRVEYVRYPGVAHDAWTQTYEDPAFWEWLLAQRRPPRS
jgi:predicted peptidase